MRRTYISPEYLHTPVNGTFNNLLESTYECSLMFSPEKTISIINEDIIYYQNSKKEQLNIDDEINTDPILFNTSILKFENCMISNDPNNNRNWILNIDYKNILFKYIFNSLKKYRMFNGIKNDMTIYQDVDIYITNYIYENIYNLYNFEKVELYIKSIDLSIDNVYKMKPIYDKNIYIQDNKYDKMNIDLSNNKLSVSFSFEEDPNLYGFSYYFNIFFKI